MSEAVELLKHCPTCGSPDPRLHPAVQYGGEVSICADAFHPSITKPAALTKPPEGEPVAWRVRVADGWPWHLSDDPDRQRDAGWEIQPLYTRPVVWPDREAVARVLHGRYEERARQQGQLGGDGHTILGGRTLTDCSPSLRQSFLEDADAILALLSASAGQVEGEKG